MHESNRRLWEYAEKTYEKYFHGPNKVVECGSHDVSGTVRQHFKDSKKYIGVDWREGPSVDVVSLIHNLKYEKCFDTVISSSLLEHDPYWVKTIKKMVQMMKPDGGLFLSWGAMLNPYHKPHHACDGQFHPLALGKVIFALEKLGLYVHEYGYEDKFGGGMGECYLFAFKNKDSVDTPSLKAELVPEDKLDLTAEEMEELNR